MNDVFIISDDQEHFNLFSTHFGHLPIHFSWAGDMNEAVKFLPLEKPSFAFLITEDIDLMMEWIGTYKNQKLDTPFVCFTKEIEWESKEIIWQSGAIELVKLPISRKELEYILKVIVLAGGNGSSETEDEIQGRLEDFNVIDLIQTFENSKKNGILILQSGPLKGEIEFNNGKIANARSSKRDPLEAIIFMATWFTGQFWVKLDRKKHIESILLDNQQVILECLNYINLRENLLRKLPEKDLLLYTLPELDYEELGPSDRMNLLKFKNGFTIEQFLENFPGNTISILERFEKWINNRWLIGQEEYQIRLKKIQEYENMSGLKKIINRLFSKSDKKEPDVTSEIRSENISVEEKMLMAVKKKANMFKDRELIISFIKALEE